MRTVSSFTRKVLYSSFRPNGSSEGVDPYFNLVVSIDHLIFAELRTDKEWRRQITIDNAEDFLKLHRSRGYTFTHVGVAQDWGPSSYLKAVRPPDKMDSKYVVISGLVRSRTECLTWDYRTRCFLQL